MKGHSLKQELTIITTTYDFIKYLIPIISKFPRTQRYLLAEKIEDHVLHIFENLIDAKFRRDKKEVLLNTNVSLEKLRFLIRLTYDFKFINDQRYQYISTQLNQIGTQLGGWIKQQ